MAVVSDGFYVSLSWVDNGGDITTRDFKMQGATQEDAETDIAGIVAALNGVTDAVLTSYHFYEKFINDAIVFPASGVEVQNQALMTYLLTGGAKRAALSIPAPKPTIFIATTGENAEIVDPADAAVIAYNALFLDAGQLYLSDGETAAQFLKGRRRHVRSARG